MLRECPDDRPSSEFLRGGGTGCKWGDTLWVWDQEPRRALLYDSGGGYLDAVGPDRFQLRDGERFAPSRPLGRDSFVATQLVSGSRSASGDVTHTPVLRINSQWEELDTLYVNERSPSIRLVLEGIAFNSSQPFSTSPHRLVDGEGETVVLVDWIEAPEPAIVVTRRTFAGDTLYRRQLPFEPTPITRADVDREVRDIAGRFRLGRSGLSEPEARRMVREAIEAPSYHRPVEAVRVGADGTVWLRMRSARPDEEPDHIDWLVLDAEGTPVRRVELPQRFTPHHLDEREVWGVLRDEFDVNYVARLALREKDA